VINLYNTEIDSLYIHKVGNKCRKEELFLSKDPYEINDEIRPILQEFFLKPFREKEAQFFTFLEGAELESILNLYGFTDDLIGGTLTPLITDKIARHLYDQGKHPHIKAGEVYICQLSNMLIDNYKMDGIGIFKSEIKYDFLEFNKEESRLDLILKQGVSLDKLDKGAIILNDPESKTGFRVLYIDSNKYDSKYWVDNFLNLVELEDDIFHTKNYLKFCENFAKDVVRPAEGKQEEIQFLNDTFHHFASRDEFQEEEYKEEVITSDAIMGEFDLYKMEKGPKYHIEDLSDFSISNETVNDSMKKIKGDIELDTGFTIKIPKGSKAAAQHLEKGWDEERQMYYYLVYFNSEKK